MIDEFLEQGTVRDPAREFMVKQARLQPGSSSFWDEALRFGGGGRAERCAPTFLQGCASELLFTGKALRLISTVAAVDANAAFLLLKGTSIDSSNNEDDEGNSHRAMNSLGSAESFDDITYDDEMKVLPHHYLTSPDKKTRRAALCPVSPERGGVPPTQRTLFSRDEIGAGRDAEAADKFSNAECKTAENLAIRLLHPFLKGNAEEMKRCVKQHASLGDDNGIDSREHKHRPGTASPRVDIDQQGNGILQVYRSPFFSTAILDRDSPGPLRELWLEGFKGTSVSMVSVNAAAKAMEPLDSSTAACAILGKMKPLSGTWLQNQEAKGTAQEDSSDLPPLFSPLEPELSRSLTRYVLERHKIVGRSLAHLLNSGDLVLRRHLRALRAFFLMSSGETARHLQDSLFPYIRARKWPQGQLLQDIIGDSLRIDPACEAVLDGRLQVRAGSRPTHRPDNSCDALEWLATLRFECTVPWPLSLVVTKRALEQYSDVFRFLLMIHYAKWCLDRLSSQRLPGARRGKSYDAPSFHAFYSLRAKMHHIVGCLQSYMTGRSVRGAWSNFAELLDGSLKETCDLPELMRAHEKYLSDIHRQMLLYKNSGAAMRKIKSLLAVCIQLQSISRLLVTAMREDTRKTYGTTLKVRLPSQQNLIKKMAEIQIVVDADVRFLLVVLSEVVAHGVQLHLKELILSFDFNSFFSKGMPEGALEGAKNW